MSAATVSRTCGSLVVKKAWKRQSSNSDAWFGSEGALKSRIRRTTSRPGTESAFVPEANAVKPTSATSALLISAPVCSSWIASVYSMVVQASSAMPAIAALMFGVIRTVTDTWAQARAAAPMVALP